MRPFEYAPERLDTTLYKIALTYNYENYYNQLEILNYWKENYVRYKFNNGDDQRK